MQIILILMINPKVLNISRGISYSGDFKNRRFSFGVSGGKPSQRQATIGER